MYWDRQIEKDPLPLFSLYGQFEGNQQNYLHKAVIDHEGDGNVQADSAHARQGSLVEGFGTLVPQYCSGTIQCVLVLGCV